MNLAAKLTDAPAVAPIRKGPAPKCDIYGPGDHEVYEALHARRQRGETWSQVQAVLDDLLGIDQPVKNDLFRYHWNGKCTHWDGVP